LSTCLKEDLYDPRRIAWIGIVINFNATHNNRLQAMEAPNRRAFQSWPKESSFTPRGERTPTRRRFWCQLSIAIARSVLISLIDALMTMAFCEIATGVIGPEEDGLRECRGSG
jgi:hypothetical protein